MSAPFLGRGWKFPVQVDATTGRMLMSEGEDDIAEAIRVILLTSRGERVMRPDFGSGLRDFVFRTMDGTTLTMLQSDLKRAITVWEPRVRDVEVQATVEPSRPGQLQIRIQYVVRSTNNLFNQVYPFYLDEGTK
ncbi:GPW/gp25 family protein [Cohnella zeiphila]|uniref:GPW/gp25 family protein n=1 Tax=Cohnella zeiphila TaxID=2761120 RepID=A0A7X0SVC9_9BACL|nr:GPW/gp25 family protein [Cohnella zeiphila]MBB6735600.1 GPW/gp25 family protein [Cohnella zeiphila]